MKSPPRVAVSLFGADRGKSGIGRYMVTVLRHMLELGEGWSWDFWVAEEDLPIFPFLKEPIHQARLRVHPVSNRWSRPAASVLWHTAIFPSLLRRSGAEALFLPAGNRRLVPFSPVPAVAVVHDLSSFHVEGKYDPLRLLYIKRVMPWLIRRCERVVTISGSSARDIVRFTRFPESRLSIVALGYDATTFYPRPAAECRQRLLAHDARFPEHYFLYVSRLEHPGKNHVGLLEAYRRLLDQDPGFPCDLVFAGGRWSGAEAIDEAIARWSLASRVRILGFVPDGLLPDLYGGARAMVFPSLYEGFGLPLLEAQACGIPVAAANASSTPEVLGAGGLLFDPRDAASIADALDRLAKDEPLRQELIRKGTDNAQRFQWQDTARRTLEVLDAVRRP